VLVGLVNEEWLIVPVCDLCEKVGFGRVVKEPVNEGKVAVKEDS
jgi:hypothetical protein